MLFALIAEGDESAFQELYDQIKPLMIGRVMKLMKSREATLEVIQETMLRIWLNRDKLPEVEQPMAWIYRIVSNECFRYLKKHGLRERKMLEMSPAPGIISNITETDLSFRETQKIISQILSTLSPRHQQIYRLSRLEGLKIQEIAGKTGLSFRYVKKVLMEVLKILRQKLIEAGRYIPIFLLWYFY